MGGTLSGGEQQMLAVGRALMQDPKLLMMDEPSLGLAPLLIEEVFRAIKKIKEDGLPILLVEQNSKAALQVADRGYVLKSVSSYWKIQQKTFCTMKLSKKAISVWDK